MAGEAEVISQILERNKTNALETLRDVEELVLTGEIQGLVVVGIGGSGTFVVRPVTHNLAESVGALDIARAMLLAPVSAK